MRQPASTELPGGVWLGPARAGPRSGRADAAGLGDGASRGRRPPLGGRGDDGVLAVLARGRPDHPVGDARPNWCTAAPAKRRPERRGPGRVRRPWPRAFPLAPAEAGVGVTGRRDARREGLGQALLVHGQLAEDAPKTRRPTAKDRALSW